jgi:hypothetical protein
MPINPKQILDSALGLGKTAVSAVEKRLRTSGRTTDSAPTTPGTPAVKTSGGPTTVGAKKPGKPGGPKSATAATEGATERPPAGRAKAPAAKPAKADKTATPRKRAAGRRTAASSAGEKSGEELNDAASRDDD